MNRKLHYFLMLVSLLCIQGMMAQGKRITGTVTDADTGGPLPGINVVEKGTRNGTSTDFDGNYVISVSGDSAILVFSAIGYTEREMAVGGQSTVNITLSENVELLGEVVVTALGIKKETKALGYSVTQVGSEEIATIKTPNAINSLQGKIAGVNITQNATGAAGSSRVIIRGNNSLTGGNQPLYVVDGIPIGNENNGAASLWGGNDGGDGISSLNADEIESISVLKGGSAAALYGSRGGNGVILITTKSGSKQEGFGIEFTSTANFDVVDTSIQDFQTTYGQGLLGEKPASQAEALEAGLSSWGPRLDGSQVVQWDGVERPYSYVGSNLKHFYRTGTTFINTVAMSSGTENTNLRFSLTDFTNDDITPNSGLNRKIFALNAGAVLAEKLTAQVSAKYSIEDVQNRPRLSDAPGNANFTVGLLSPNVDVRFMNPAVNEDGSERQYSDNVFSQNPYFAAFNFRNEDTRNRLIASATLRYDVLDWLYVTARAGIDHYTLRRTNVTPFGTAFQPLGSIVEDEYRYSQVDSDIILGVEKDITEKFAVNAFVGANRNSIDHEVLRQRGDDFIVPGLEDVGNTARQSRDRNFDPDLNNFGERKIGSVYGSLELSYNRYAYLTFTGRNDWFSTLSFPGKETSNNDFYPSVSGSLILSDMFEMPTFVNFLKLRSGFSQTAGGADQAYQLALTYEIFDQGHLGQPLGRITGGTVPNANLVPWNKDEFEIGFDARFFGNRLSLDFAYYTNQITSDIVKVTTSVGSGFNDAIFNIGEIENKGVELLISGTPIRTQNFEWTTSVNASFNEGIVVGTNDAGDPIFLDEPRTRNVRIAHVVGERYGTIFGTSYVRDNNGNIVYDIDDDGVPIARQGERKILGDGVPPWTIGFSNSIRYKDFNLNFLIDGKFGGQLFSGTNTTAYGTGLHQKTIEGREGGLAVSGIDGATFDADTGTGTAFTATVAPANLQTYWGRVNDIAEEFVEDSDYIRFRQLSLGYTFPTAILGKTFIKSATINLLAQNLFYIKRSIDNVDPESAYNVSNSQGLEYFGVPTTRGYGVSLNVKF
ncbi:SusC/RagA family TonB-linked outer membrane protein [Flagellimonas hymeniacidonis]|uniref:SusC/RagA family TonB-linked outer membrane protein n=1 Tax=Flagellimonas hymeniacidonis TaxID=2603628 RepID=A0A5C8V808_9FLAO|nr:SusC/RagA family TonB-linked outer membrane protein [Flagellimonas hymeniacidonis]TXN37269.1 SusC/RagA family TonB-linked outer membrane protein [Flagellimonas hymeniacidonis]